MSAVAPILFRKPHAPQALLAWLPFLWGRVLFPGRSEAPDPVRLWPALLVLVLPGTLLYPCLSFRLFEPDEGRYAQIPREMLLRGEAVVPYLQGEPYLDKPPLFYWLVLLSYQLFGVQDWAARLVPAWAVHGCVLLTYFLGRRSLGERPALWGALILSLAPGFISVARLLVLDGLLTFWVTLAVFSAFEATRGDSLRRGWWLLAAAACGLGVLTKGPVAVLLLVPPLWLYRRLQGSPFTLGPRAWLAFAGIVLLIALPWYAAVTIRLPQFARYFLWEHNVVRFLAPFDHLEPFWFYLPILAGGLLPGTLLALPLVRFLLSGDPDAARARTPELGFMLLAGGWCVLFFSLSGCKLPTYVLPAFPFLALALGHALTHTAWGHTHWPVRVAGGTFLILLVAHTTLIPWYAGYRSPLTRPDEVVAYCGDPAVPLVSYPRNCDSVAFYLGRDDLKTFRSKQIQEFRNYLLTRPRTVVLFTHRHSFQAFAQTLPPGLRIARSTRLDLGDVPLLPDWLDRKAANLLGQTPMSLCDIALIECPSRASDACPSRARSEARAE